MTTTGITPELIAQAIEETRRDGQASCVRQRCDFPVCVWAYRSDGDPLYPLHGERMDDHGIWVMAFWQKNGEGEIDLFDLVPEPQRVVREGRILERSALNDISVDHCPGAVPNIRATFEDGKLVGVELIPEAES